MKSPSIAEYRALLASCPSGDIRGLLEAFESDSRAGVRALAADHRRRHAALLRETARLDRLMERQLSLHATGIAVVAGVDEVGRGALAGPLTVAAVVLDAECRIPLLDDSKRLTPKRREVVAAHVHAMALTVSIVDVGPAEIDSIGIAAAVRVGMERAIRGLAVPVGHTLVDGNDTRLPFPATPVVGGDRLCACISAASVVAKVSRDALMRSLAAEYPAFGFDVNKGYGTPEHIAAIRGLGPSPLHRRSFAPCSQGPLF